MSPNISSTMSHRQIDEQTEGQKEKRPLDVHTYVLAGNIFSLLKLSTIQLATFAHFLFSLLSGGMPIHFLMHILFTAYQHITIEI
jgi:hypothetical protein